MTGGRWLFQHFEERIGAGFVQVISVFDDEDARGAFEWTKVRFAFQFANGFHADDLEIRPDHRDVTVFAPDHAFAIIGGVRKSRKT